MKVWYTIAINFIFTTGLIAQVDKKVDKKTESKQSEKSFLLSGSVGLSTTNRYSFNWFDANGLVVSLEPEYRLKKNFSLGVRAEYSLVKHYLSGEKNAFQINAPAIPSLSLFGNYSFLKDSRKVIPYLSVGAGLYALGTGVVENSNRNVDLGVKFGATLRAGVRGNRSGLAVEINGIKEHRNANRDYISFKYTYRLIAR